MSRAFEPSVGELTFAIQSVVIPERVGVPSGRSEVRLIGQTSHAPQHPGDDYQATQLYERMPMDRVRLGRYRWRFVEATVEPPSAKLAVDRAAMAGRLDRPRLADGDEVTFWLSTQGVADLELETPLPAVSKYSDYVQVELSAHAGHDGSAWTAWLRARRCFTGCETVCWERALVLGEPATDEVSLGDHRLELLEVAWLGVSPVELHARFRLRRGATKDGLEPRKPAPPWRPHVR